MNDRVNGYDPMTHTNRPNTNLSTVGGLMALSEIMDKAYYEIDTEVRDRLRADVESGLLSMTNALVGWLANAYYAEIIDLLQFTDAVHTVSVIHAEVLSTLFEYIFGSIYKGDVEGMV